MPPELELPAAFADVQGASPGRDALAGAHLVIVVNACWFFVSHRLNIAIAAREHGCRVTVVAAPDSTADRLAEHGIAFVPLDFTRRGLNPLREGGTLLRLVRLLRRLSPDVVHLVTSKPILFGGIAARIGGVQAVVAAVSGLGSVFIAEGFRARLLRSSVEALYRAALRHPRRRVIFQNADDLRRFVDRRIVDEGDAIVIPGSGVDPAVFVPGRRDAAVPLVVLAARMLRDKGVQEFVGAARILRAEGVAARFALVGDPDPGNPTSLTQDEIGRWTDEGVVEYWGRRSDMPEVFRQADVACLPSYREGLPKVLLEAAACGLPVVTTDVPGCRDAILPEQTGLLVPARDPAALAGALRRVLASPTLRRRMGDLGRERVCAGLTAAHVSGQTLQIYRDLLEHPAQS